MLGIWFQKHTVTDCNEKDIACSYQTFNKSETSAHC